jgi:hypothetical protein
MKGVWKMKRTGLDERKIEIFVDEEKKSSSHFLSVFFAPCSSFEFNFSTALVCQTDKVGLNDKGTRPVEIKPLGGQSGD